MMDLKHRYRLGFEALVEEVADSLVWRSFCHLCLTDKVPDTTTLMKLTHPLGPEAVEKLGGPKGRSSNPPSAPSGGYHGGRAEHPPAHRHRSSGGWSPGADPAGQKKPTTPAWRCGSPFATGRPRSSARIGGAPQHKIQALGPAVRVRYAVLAREVGVYRQRLARGLEQTHLHLQGLRIIPSPAGKPFRTRCPVHSTRPSGQTHRIWLQAGLGRDAGRLHQSWRALCGQPHRPYRGKAPDGS